MDDKRVSRSAVSSMDLQYSKRGYVCTGQGCYPYRIFRVPIRTCASGISSALEIPGRVSGDGEKDGEACTGLDEFTNASVVIGGKHNYGLQPGLAASAKQIEAFLNSLHLTELALAHACAHGRERAQRFLDQYRAAPHADSHRNNRLSSLGHDLSDSQCGTVRPARFEGNRRSPLASYSGRGSLQRLRTTIVQRWRDHQQCTRCSATQ